MQLQLERFEMSLDELNISIESRGSSLSTAHVTKKLKKPDDSLKKLAISDNKAKRKYTKQARIQQEQKVIIPGDNLSPPPSCSPLSSQSSQFSNSLSFSSSVVSLPYTTSATEMRDESAIYNQYLNQFEAHFAFKCGYQTADDDNNSSQIKLNEYTNFDFDNENSMDSNDESFSTEMGCKRDRTGAVLTQQRQAANMRERRRMQSINDAFEGLRIHLPTLPYEKKISKVETLKLAIGYINFLTDLLNKDTRYSSQSSSSKEVKKFVYTFKDFDYASNSLIGHSLSWKNSRELNLTQNRTFVSKLWHITSIIKADEELKTYSTSESGCTKAKMSLSLSDNEDERSDSEDEDEFGDDQIKQKSNHVVLNEHELLFQYHKSDKDVENLNGLLPLQQQDSPAEPFYSQQTGASYYTATGNSAGYETTAFMNKNNSYINQPSYYNELPRASYNFNETDKTNKYYSDLNNNLNGCHSLSQHGIENIPEGMQLPIDQSNGYQHHNSVYFSNNYSGLNNGQYCYNMINPDDNIMSINNNNFNDYSFNNQSFYQS